MITAVGRAGAASSEPAGGEQQLRDVPYRRSGSHAARAFCDTGPESLRWLLLKQSRSRADGDGAGRGSAGTEELVSHTP